MLALLAYVADLLLRLVRVFERGNVRGKGICSVPSVTALFRSRVWSSPPKGAMSHKSGG